jgi:hypothetical protein
MGQGLLNGLGIWVGWSKRQAEEEFRRKIRRGAKAKAKNELGSGGPLVVRSLADSLQATAPLPH